MVEAHAPELLRSCAGCGKPIAAFTAVTFDVAAPGSAWHLACAAVATASPCVRLAYEDLTPSQIADRILVGHRVSPLALFELARAFLELDARVRE